MKEPLKVEYKGEKVRAVGSRIYFSPPDQTFHDFCIQIIKSDFGVDWYRKEQRKSEEDQHVVYKWFKSYTEFIKKHSQKQKKNTSIWSARATGDVWSIATLGYDLFSVHHSNSMIPHELYDRLKSRANFQGARYEIGVAAFFARQNFKIEFVKRKSEKHWEFNATNKLRNEIIAVEVKSRHRPGVIHQSGNELEFNEIKVGIARVLNEALKQKPENLPFIIFIDLNLPATSEKRITEKKWWNDLLRAIDLQKVPTKEDPDDFNMLFLTNFSYHYAGKAIVDTNAFNTDVCVVIPKYSKIPFVDNSTASILDKEVSTYGYIPYDW